MSAGAGRAALFGIPAALCAAWTVHAGKDLNWDLLHYHLYLPYELLGGRITQDYFAASAQSYLNPVGFLPFYALVMSGLPSVLASIVLAVAHGMNLVLLYRVSEQLLAHHPQRQRALLSTLATALGAASAVFWAMTGTSFLDPLLTLPMLGGVLLLLRGQAGWAGVLFGIAAALKYSNAFFALAAIALVRGRRGFLAYAAGGAIAVALFALPWLAVLYREFGNPVFPLLNSVFRSPDFPPIHLGAERFAPRELADALTFPLRIANPEFMTYAEISAPDFRFAALGLALAGAAAVRRRLPEIASADTRFFLFFFVSMAAWIWTSGNARYGILLLLLVGPCVARALDAAGGARAARLGLAVMLVVQLTACLMVSPPRWFITERWTGAWLPFAAPERARSEPALYLTIEAQSMMAVAPFLHPGSSFVNLRGQHSLAPGWKRIDGLIARHGDRIRVLGRGLRLQEDGLPRPEVLEVYDSTLLRFGFRVDTADCYAIGWEGDETGAASRLANALAPHLETRARLLSLASCALARAERDPADIAAEARISAVFDRVEKGCPRLFQGHSSNTDPLGEEWSRTYAGLEARLETRGDRLVLAPFFKLGFYDLGAIADWERDTPVLPAACRHAS